MAKTLQQILGAENQIGVIQTVVGGVPDGLLPPALVRPTRTVQGQQATWREVNSTRKTARITRYGSKAREVDHQGMTERTATAIHTFENQHHGPALLDQLLRPDSDERQRLAEQEIDRQSGIFGQRFRNLRLSGIYSALARGRIDWDSDGNVQDSNSTYQVDFGLSSGNQNQFNTEADGSGDTILSANWDAAATKIISHLKLLKEVARKRTGHPLRHVLYGRKILEYLLTNNEVKEFLKTRVDMANSFSMGEIPDGFMGMRWWSVNEAFYEKDDGTTADWFSDDALTFLPEVNNQWWEFLRGTYVIPNDVGGVASGASRARGQFSMVEGEFSYAVISHNPPGIDHYAGDTFLPVLVNPDAVFIGSAPTS